MRYISYCFSTLLLLFFLSSCGSESTPVYSLTSTPTPDEAGSVSPSSGEYDEGETLEITATPNEGWEFDQWMGDDTGTSNPVTITMSEDKTLTALFNRLYPLTVNIEGEGSVSERVVQQKTTDYSEGTVVELTANPEIGWEFDSWEGDLSGSENPETITLDEEKEVIAKFLQASYVIDATIDGEGSITFSPEKEEYSYGEEVTIAVKPAEGWNFVHWDEDLDGTDSEITVEIESDLQITAVLDESPFEGGDGSAEYPYLVSTIEQLQAVTDYTRSHFSQINDIDATETVDWNDGSGFEPIGDNTFKFQGVYDGDNYEIKNLYMDDWGVATGLFENNDEGELTNIKLVNVSIKGGSQGDYYTGALVARNNGDVINVFVDGTISGGGEVGGIVGSTTGCIYNVTAKVEVSGGLLVGGISGRGGSNIENSTVEGSISGTNTVGGISGSQSSGNVIQKSSFTGSIEGGNNVGGIVGNGNGTVVQSFANATVIGEENVGGIVGKINYQYGNDLVENNYFLGSVEGLKNIGGIIGIIDSDDIILYTSLAIGEVKGDENVGGLIGTNVGDMDNSYWNTESTGQEEPVGRGFSDGATGLTTSEMQGSATQENMPEFDWEEIWMTVSGDYPILRWQEE